MPCLKFQSCSTKDSGVFFVFAGYQCEPFNNPLDFIMDVLQGDYEAEHIEAGDGAKL